MPTIRSAVMLISLLSLVLLGAACGDDDDGGGGRDVAAYCALSAQLDAQETLPTEEQFDELRELAPGEISDEINAIADGFEEQGVIFGGSEEAAELFDPIQAFEDENCPDGGFG
jgi:hypothetical protein